MHTDKRSSRRAIRRAAMLCCGGLFALAAPVRAHAQGQKSACTILCTPNLSFNAAAIRSHIFSKPMVRDLSTGAVKEVPSATNLELQLFVSVPTVLARTSLYMTAQWLPNATATSNPFTEYTASTLGGDVRANTPSLSFGADFDVLRKKHMGGAFNLVVYAADLFSKAARPDDMSDYTHKLDLGTYTTIYPFFWLADGNALKRSGLYAYVTLDYVATGLPRAGDEVPKGQRVYVTSARPAALIIGAGLPIAPLF
ncbi:MAG: hypothetical protein ACR2MQ_16325 [Gemmatimonadaceae bacterium]